MTEQHNEERWRLALEGIGDAARKYETLTRIVQNGFGTIGERLDRQAQDIGELKREVKAVKAEEVECRQQLVSLKERVAGNVRLISLLMALVIVLIVASFIQTGLWWYVVTRLFHV